MSFFNEYGNPILLLSQHEIRELLNKALLNKFNEDPREPTG